VQMFVTEICTKLSVFLTAAAALGWGLLVLLPSSTFLPGHSVIPVRDADMTSEDSRLSLLILVLFLPRLGVVQVFCRFLGCILP
jgi:hypothetical protein